MSGGNEANAPSAEGFAHKPGQSRDEESNDFYGISFGEAQLIPRCSSVVLGGDAPAFDWETKAKKGNLNGIPAKTCSLEKSWARRGCDLS